jgi:hypothetical protein
VGDVTGCGKADLVAFDPGVGAFVAVSTGTAFQTETKWTTAFAGGHIAYSPHALGDIDGDGRDNAVCFQYGDDVYAALSSWQ